MFAHFYRRQIIDDTADFNARVCATPNIDRIRGDSDDFKDLTGKFFYFYKIQCQDGVKIKKKRTLLSLKISKI